MTAKSTRRGVGRKLTPPPKPAGFPLNFHRTGKFQKWNSYTKKVDYFGAWAVQVNGKLTLVPGGGFAAALEEYEATKAKTDHLIRESIAMEQLSELKKQKLQQERTATLDAEAEALEAEVSGKLRLVQLCNLFLESNGGKWNARNWQRAVSRITWKQRTC